MLMYVTFHDRTFLVPCYTFNKHSSYTYTITTMYYRILTIQTVDNIPASGLSSL